MRKLAMFVYGKRIVGSNPTFLVCFKNNTKFCFLVTRLDFSV